jgi:glucose/arabinose dehydrogenase
MMRALIAATTLAVATTVSAQTLTDTNLIVSPFITGLSQPTGIRFIGPNQAFIIEKTGALRYYNAGAISTPLSLSVSTDSERGLLGIAIDPAFATNGFVYLYHSVRDTTTGNWVENRLSRFTWNAATSTFGASPTTLMTFGTSSDGQTNGPNHNGGPLAFGNDGKLYGVTGDLNRNRVEQNNKAVATSAFAGGVFRLDTDGSIPSDNPFSGAFSRWYAYGVRNSFGLAFDPVTNALWDTENGPDSYDEINRIERGMNSGWSAIQGPDSRDSQNAPNDLNMLPGASYRDPVFSFRDTIGITSIQFLHGSSWGPNYDDAVLVGENNNARLRLFRLNAARDGFVLSGLLADQVLDPGDPSLVFGDGFSVTTDIQVGPDGAVYIATLGNGQIVRIAPVPEPKVWALSLAGLLVVLWAVFRRRSGR